jgi:hypothetical protein
MNFVFLSEQDRCQTGEKGVKLLILCAQKPRMTPIMEEKKVMPSAAFQDRAELRKTVIDWKLIKIIAISNR